MTDREALEMALEALTNPSTISVQHAIKLIRAELAKPEMPTKIFGPNLEQILNAAGFYRQPEQEPVAWQVMVENEPMKEFSIKDMAHDWAVTEKRNGSKYSYWIRPLYAALPKREWVWLTEEEIKKIMQRWRGEFDIRDIERLLKEKNT